METDASDRKAVILLSGGLDSTTVLAIVTAQGFLCHCLSFDYGQRQAIELENARNSVRQFAAKAHLILRLDLDRIGGSALTCKDFEVPKGREVEAMAASIPITYVPARNAIFLSYATAWAEVLGASDIFLGVNALDYSGYPDCRPEFLEAFERMINLGTKAGVDGARPFRIHAPLLRLSKKEIIMQGTALGVDYGKTHSCYDPDERGRACGECDACRLRLCGFAEAGLIDPAVYCP